MSVAHAVITWLWINTAGNLVASAITTTLGLWWHHRRIKRHHVEELRQTRVHLLGALAETRDHLLKAIGDQQGGDQ